MTNLTRNTVALFAGLAAFAVAAPPARAQLGSRPADEWIKTLESTNRVQGLKIAETVDALDLTPGMMVADIGAGTGLFTLPLARAVRPGGTAFAVEVDETLLEYVAEMATEQGVANVSTVYGEYDDPLLGGGIDLAFIHDVLHHIEHRDTYLKNLAGYLKPGGRIAVVDFIPGRGGHREDATMELSKDQVSALMAEAGMKLLEEVNIFDDKFYVIYVKP